MFKKTIQIKCVEEKWFIVDEISKDIGLEAGLRRINPKEMYLLESRLCIVKFLKKLTRFSPSFYDTEIKSPQSKLGTNRLLPIEHFDPFLRSIVFLIQTVHSIYSENWIINGLYMKCNSNIDYRKKITALKWSRTSFPTSKYFFKTEAVAQMFSIRKAVFKKFKKFMGNTCDGDIFW